MAIIEGNSGCRVRLRGTERLSKRSADSDYSPRLQAQIRKQEEFRAACKLPGVVVPGILGTRCDEEGMLEVEMEFAPGLDILDFLSRCGKSGIENLADALHGFIGWCLERSRPEDVPRELFDKKLEAIETAMDQRDRNGSRIGPRLRQAVGEVRAAVVSGVRLPVGTCHGDLTLSNVLIQDDGRKLILIDFLDSFVETPIFDMVKLRQDTRWGWSGMLDKRKFDDIRLSMALSHLDRLLDGSFREIEAYRTWGRTFQLLGHLRIVPYAREDRILAHLDRVVGAIMETP